MLSPGGELTILMSFETLQNFHAHEFFNSKIRTIIMRVAWHCIIVFEKNVAQHWLTVCTNFIARTGCQRYLNIAIWFVLMPPLRVSVLIPVSYILLGIGPTLV